MTDQQPNPNIPDWARQPQQPAAPGGWGPAPQPPKKKHTGLKIAGGIVGAIIVISIIGAATGSGGKSDNQPAAAPATSTTQPAATAPSTKAAPAPKATHKAAPKPVAKTVLTESGNGIKSTARFHVNGDWDLHYTYNCSAFGMKGNFVVTTGGGDFPDVLANELGMKGTVTTHQHDGGSLYLEVNSECSWTLKVIDIP
jgi:hypothetical protein